MPGVGVHLTICLASLQTARRESTPPALIPLFPSSFPTRRRSLCSTGCSDDRGREFPAQIEDWQAIHVESWLADTGFGRYIPGFANDGGGIGVDGNRLVYLGTEDQLDHIEWQLGLLGVEESDQWLLSDLIRQLVAASEIDPSLLESLATSGPKHNLDGNGDNFAFGGGSDEGINDANYNNDFQI